MNLLTQILYDSIYHCCPILLLVIGGVFAYKANVLNIALEGMMAIAAFCSVFCSYYTKSLYLGFLAGLLASLSFALLFCVVGIRLRGNIIIVGLALNLLAQAIASFCLARMNMANITLSFLNTAELQWRIPLLSSLPLLGPVFSGHTVSTYLSIVGLLAMSICMYRLRLGLYIRVVGEKPEAARSLGIRVHKYQYIAIFFGAFWAAVAGFNLAPERLGLYTPNMTAGRGFIAIAAIYCGRGCPLRSAAYALLFGLARSLAVNLGIYAGAAAGLFDVIPYLVMIIVLFTMSFYKRRLVLERGFCHEN